MDIASVLPVAYLPGAAGRSTLWKPIAERLALRRQAVLCSYPGLAGVPPDPKLRSFSDLLQHVLEQLPARCDLVAMSMGGVLALRLALEHPRRIRKLVLVATSGGLDVQRLGGLEWRDTYRHVLPDAPSWFLDERTDLSDRLQQVTAPSLLVFGDDDAIAPVAVGERLLELLPNARLEVIPGGTHDLQEESPDLLASLIEAHLRRP